ncbi:MAG: patatin [Bacteroidetes bacterium QS_1_65_9]|nr:MAG: patatin [Bacteroidetes bacterium QS_1_65_9]
MKFGLACAGGVVEGAVYEIGALCALEEAIDGLDFTEMGTYVGVSSGGLVTACLANGIPARTLSRAVISQADPTLNLEPEVLFTPALGEFRRRLGQAPRAALKALWKYASAPFDLSPVGALAEMSSLLPVGLFDNHPFEEYLSRVFAEKGRTNDFRTLAARGRRLRVLAVQLDSSELVAFGGDGAAGVPVSKAVQASTALPGLYCPVEIDGAYYIDGVARRTMNASLALEAGVDLLFCINPIVPVDAMIEENLTDGLRPRLVDHGLPSVLAQTFRAAIHSRRRAGSRDYAHRFPDADVVLMEPSLQDPSLFFSNIFSFANRYAVCERAYRTTRAALRRRRDEMRAKLWRHDLRLNEDALADEERTLFGRLRPASERPYGESTFDRAHDALDRLEHALDPLADGGGRSGRSKAWQRAA